MTSWIVDRDQLQLGHKKQKEEEENKKTRKQEKEKEKEKKKKKKKGSVWISWCDVSNGSGTWAKMDPFAGAGDFSVANGTGPLEKLSAEPSFIPIL